MKTATVSSGDIELYNAFRRVRQDFSEYLENLTKLVENLEKIEIKVRALMYPTSENKLKAVSIPSTKKLSENIENIINNKKVNYEKNIIVWINLFCTNRMRDK